MSPQAQTQNSMNHFSHPHPLLLIPSNHCQNSSCSGCKSQIATGMIYSCTPCNYFLDTSCAEMPQGIVHPYDPKTGHSLILRVYGEASYSYCDACGKQGKGFVYHCKVCQIDLHARCASAPMSWIHQSHPHELKLLFSPTHHDKKFKCDVCHENGSSQWLYRCDSCDFDVHLDCKNVAIFGAFPNQTPGSGSSSRSAAHGPPPPPPPQYPHGFDPATVMPILQKLERDRIMNQQQIQALLEAQQRPPGRDGGGLGRRLIVGLGVRGLFQALSGNIPGIDMNSFQGLLAGGLDFGSLLGS